MEPRIVRSPITRQAWEDLTAPPEADLIKVVVDVERSLAAIGGELHADSEQLLLDDGSKQEHLWGANIYPKRPAEEQLEYESMINIRPRAGNRSMEIQDPTIRAAVRTILCRVVPLPLCTTKP